MMTHFNICHLHFRLGTADCRQFHTFLRIERYKVLRITHAVANILNSCCSFVFVCVCGGGELQSPNLLWNKSTVATTHTANTYPYIAIQSKHLN